MGTIASILITALNILPNSPFKAIINSIDGIGFLDTLNWFVPFDIAVGMLEIWGTCMLAYYIYKTVKKNVSGIIGKFMS